MDYNIDVRSALTRLLGEEVGSSSHQSQHDQRSRDHHGAGAGLILLESYNRDNSVNGRHSQHVLHENVLLPGIAYLDRNCAALRSQSRTEPPRSYRWRSSLAVMPSSYISLSLAVLRSLHLSTAGLGRISDSVVSRAYAGSWSLGQSFHNWPVWVIVWVTEWVQSAFVTSMRALLRQHVGGRVLGTG